MHLSLAKAQIWSLSPHLQPDACAHAQREIEGEVLLTTRRFYSNASVCPDPRESESESEDEFDPSMPIDHATEPMAPVPEWTSTSGFARETPWHPGLD